MITADDLYALTQESPTACHLLPDLCEALNINIVDVKAPEAKHTANDDVFESEKI